VGPSSRRALTLAVALLIAFSLPLFQHVVPVYATEPSLTDIFNNLGFKNVTQLTVETFPAGTYNITLYAKFGGNNELSYYEINTSSFNVLFIPSEPTMYGYVTPPLTKTLSADYQFGLSLLSWQDTRYFTETALNPDGYPHAKVYMNLNNPSMLLIGFDERSDCTEMGDGDFNDMVFSLQLQYYLNVVSPYDTPSGEGWYYNGTEAFASLASGVVDHGNGTRRVFIDWSGDASGTSYSKSNAIVMNQNKTAIANWKTQYSLTFNQTGLDDTATGTVVTLNEVTRSFEDLPFSMWVDSSTAITYSYSNVSSIISGKRFVLTGVTGPLSPITVTSPVTVTGNYKTQYRITFNQSGVGPDFAGTVVTIDGTGYTVGTLPASFWWDKDSTHTFSVSSPLIISASKQCVWISTAGLSTLQSGTLTITDSGSITGNYKTQYYLTVSSPYGSPSPSSGWFDAGVSVTASVTSPWPGPAATRYFCTGWTGAGSVSASGTATAVTFTINQPSSIAWNWKTQYYLTVKTNPAGITTIPGEGWYNESASVTLTAPTVPNYQFNYWDVDGTSQGSGVNPITVHMNKPRTATGHYAPAAPPPSVSISPLSASIYVGQSVTFTSTVSGGTPPYSCQWYLSGNPVLGVTSSTWTFKPTMSGIYYIYLKVTDANGNVAQSETARIVVSVVPVGGYSISSTRPVAMTPLICYTILLAIFGATISLIKRKRK